jgi:type I restriction enzyme M protein
MRQFLNEEVTYINKEQIDEAFRFLEKDNDPDATKATIHKFFIQLKFFTNNDFAFIDVHNERLFQENATVLRSIVEMLQDIKLKSDSENSSNQFLGDMFEGFLDSGVKQSEGQFFTPMPIVKFIMNSLPLEDMLIISEEPPKAIDYACGAGHFLTELARQITPLVEKYKKAEISEYYSNIIGIEKEYRLSKVAKVSAFMYGQDDIQIIYADALAKNELIKNNSFNILVANPPYSVKGFLETLKHPDRKAFELFGSIDEKGILTNNSIETFFIERAKQLLAPDGVAAIILPSSVLSNDANQYRQTREILLQHFHLIAIAELGSGTFGKTGTNTVTLFLKRRKLNPSEAEHYKYRAQCWIDGDVSARTKKNKQYNDLHLLEDYCKHIDIPFADYKYFLTEGVPNETLMLTEIWKEYEKTFYESTEIKNLQKRPAFKQQKPEAQKEELQQTLYRRIRHLETEKLYYFLLAHSNEVPVLIIKSPADNKAMKKFLGYEWSAAKGNEGIKYLNSQPVTTEEDEPVLITAQLNAIQTPMYNAAQKNDDTKLNYYINENFLGKSFMLPEALSEFAHTSRLADMLDFNRKDFSKAISLSGKKIVEVVSKFDTIKLREIVSNIGGLWTGKKQPFITTKVIRNTNFGKNGLLDVSDIANIEVEVNQFNNRKLQKGDIIIEKSGGSETQAVGRVVLFNLDNDSFSFSNFTARLRNESKNVESEFLFLVLNDFYNKGYTFNFQSGSSGLKNLDLQKYLEVKIPVPPFDVQKSIVAECRKVDEAVSEASQNIENSKAEIEKKVERTFQLNFPLKNIKQIARTNPSKTEIKDLENDMIVSFIDMASVSNEGFIEHKEDRQLKAVRKGSYTYFAENDIIMAKITPCMENGKCALAKKLTNEIALGSSEFHVIRAGENILPEYLFYHLNRQKIRHEAEANMTGSSDHRRVPISVYENLKIPVPPLPIQQKLVKEIEILEAQIATAQNVIQNAPTQKQQILKMWLE